MRTLTVLGSTGSIGTNTLDVVRRNRELYRVYALVAGRNMETLSTQIVEFRPQVAAVATPEALARLTESGGCRIAARRMAGTAGARPPASRSRRPTRWTR